MQQWKKIIQNDGLMNGKFNVSSLIVHVQKYKLIDFLYDLFTDMKNSSEYPDYHSVWSRRLDASSDRQPFETAVCIWLSGIGYTGL